MYSWLPGTGWVRGTSGPHDGSKQSSKSAAEPVG